MIIGSLANMIAILLGSSIGLLLNRRLSPEIQNISYTGLGLAILVLGMQMSLKMENFIIVIFSIVLGGIAGEILQLDHRIDRLGKRLESKMKAGNDRFAEGLVTAFLIYCVGSLSILGPLEEGLRNDPSLLLTKSVLDGVTSVVLASVYGSGVLFSAFPVFLFQASITLVAAQLEPFLSDGLINQISAVGGLLIIGLGINLLKLKEIPVIKLVPALLVVVVINFLWF